MAVHLPPVLPILHMGDIPARHEPQRGAAMRVFKRKRTIGGKVREDDKWSIEFRDHLDIVHRMGAFTDKQASTEMGNQIDKLVGWKRAGISPNPETQTWLNQVSPEFLQQFAEWGLVAAELANRDTPLPTHLQEFHDSLLAKGRTAKYCQMRLFKTTSLFEACQFKFYGDINGEKVEKVLAKMKVGGKAQETLNHYIRAVKQFTRWMVDTERDKKNPLTKLQCESSKADRRIDRRELSGQEITLLMLATRAGKMRAHLTGEQRAMLYAVALGTGLRANELHSLTARSFKLAAEPCRVVLGAADEKNKEGAELPLPADLVVSLRKWLPTCPPGPLWPGKWAKHTAAGKMFKADLKRARLAWLKEAEAFPEEHARRVESDFLLPTDHDSKKVDFHALRHTYLSRLGRSGVSAKVMQMLARHSTVELTIGRYTHAKMLDLAGAVEKLPPLEGNAPASQPEMQRATGTDGRAPDLPAESGPRNGPFLHHPPVPTGSQEFHLEGEHGRPFLPINEKNTAKSGVSQGIPGKARTCNLRLRRPTLYPIELRRHVFSIRLHENKR